MDVTKLTNRVLECSSFIYTVTTGKQRAGDPYFKLHTGTRVLTQHVHTLLLTHLLLTSSLGQDTHVWCVLPGHNCGSAHCWGTCSSSDRYRYIGYIWGSPGNRLVGGRYFRSCCRSRDTGSSCVRRRCRWGTRYSSWSDAHRGRKGCTAVLHHSDRRGARGIRSTRTQGRVGLKSCALGAG